MSDIGYGVYFSARNTDGVLISVNRAQWSEVKDDLETIFGDDYAERVVDSMAGNAALPEGATLHSISDSPPAPLTAADVASSLGATVGETEAPAAPAHTFEKCDQCGGVKDQWKPPGVSKAGKKYQGFYGCSNWRNH